MRQPLSPYSRYSYSYRGILGGLSLILLQLAVMAVVARNVLKAGNVKGFAALCLFVLAVNAPLYIVISLASSDIIVDRNGIFAEAIGLTWKFVSWADVAYVQKIRIIPQGSSQPTNIRFFIGVTGTNRLPITFSSKLPGVVELLRVIEANRPPGSKLYSDDSVGPSYNRNRSGSIVEHLDLA